jgi:hypothetical protein
MKRVEYWHYIAVASLAWSFCIHGAAQDKQAVKITPVPAPPANTSSLSPLADPATKDQIREYLSLSGDMDSFRAR